MTARMPAATATLSVQPKNEAQGMQVPLDPILAGLDEWEASEWMLDRPNATAAEFEARFDCEPPAGWFPGIATADEWL